LPKICYNIPDFSTMNSMCSQFNLISVMSGVQDLRWTPRI
jgi:hypothetical protein